MNIASFLLIPSHSTSPGEWNCMPENSYKNKSHWCCSFWYDSLKWDISVHAADIPGSPCRKDTSGHNKSFQAMCCTVGPPRGVAMVRSAKSFSTWDRLSCSESESSMMGKDMYPLQQQQNVALVIGQGPVEGFCDHCDSFGSCGDCHLVASWSSPESLCWSVSQNPVGHHLGRTWEVRGRSLEERKLPHCNSGMGQDLMDFYLVMMVGLSRIRSWENTGVWTSTFRTFLWLTTEEMLMNR